MSPLVHEDMKKVRDTSTSKNIQKPETYMVDDATQTEPTIDDRLEQFKAPPEQPRPSGAEMKLPEKVSITEALEKLVFIGRLSEIVEIGESKFEISTLTNREHNEIIKTMYSFKDPADLFAIRIITLANALRTIDGVSLDSIDIEGNFESDLHRRMSIIDHLQISVIEKLYAAYEKLVGEEEETSSKDEEIKN